jgi:hypothetical protein
MPAGNTTVNAQFELIPQLNITFSGYTGEIVDLTTSPDNDLNRAIPTDKITVSISGSGISILSWYLDGLPIDSSAGTLSQVFWASEQSAGFHHVTVVATRSGVPYSKELYFNVTE